MYVDVHAHLIHPAFEGEEDAIAERARAAGLDWVIVNGLEPVSNRRVLELCERHEGLLPALGIYPVDAIARDIARSGWTHDHPAPEPFDTDAEIAFIDANAHRIIAVGECGLDRYWVAEHAAEQERVFEGLCDVAMRHDLPVIIHTRKAERRSLEILQALGVQKADFHCFGGKLDLARKAAEAGYYLSIPPVVERADSFQRIAARLPLDRLLTETDCPYMGPDRGERNEPANVPRGVAAMARARDISEDAMASAIRENFRRLFGR
ncbi:MAG: TatD family hydrolase [Deltaproteobacteria bacterium]|nr:TatD family hydrolase [Deltaproteobacteria bacterium]MCB9786129.1 TatD family hydrolase [Deltaproteobacteria bacterium]